MTQPQNKEYKLLIAFFIAMGVIFILIMYIIFKKDPFGDLRPDNSKILRDSITSLTTQIDKEKNTVEWYKHQTDSVLAIPPVISIIYREQKKFTSVATINQLDSIIRATTGLKR